MADELPPANMVLQVLHLIRADIVDLKQEQVAMKQEQVAMRQEQVAMRQEQVATHAKLDALDRRVTAGFLETNTKLADLTLQVAFQGDRIENLMLGQLGQDVRDLKARRATVESKVGILAAHEAPAGYGPEKK